MNVQLDWPADIVEQLTDKARQFGLTLDAYLLEAALHRYDSEATAAERHRQRVEAIDAIRELRKQVKPDPDGWTVQDYINYGRRG